MQQTAHRNVQPPAFGSDWIEALVGSIATAVAVQLRQHPAARQPAPSAPVQAPAGSPFLSVEEAAVFLRCKPQRVYDLLSIQALGRYKDGTRVLIKRSELEMYITAIDQIRTGAQRATGHA